VRRPYLPNADAEFDTWTATFLDYLTRNAGALGVSAQEVQELTDALGLWGSTFGNQQQLSNSLEAATQAKNAQRAVVEALVRPLVQFIQKRPQTTDEQRRGLGITVADGTRTVPPVPTSHPLVQVDASQRLQHTLTLRDENAPTSRSRPVGVTGAEVYCYVNGTPPTDPRQCKLVAVAKKSTVRVAFDGADAGKNAHYLVRWITSRGDAGPWSETASATVAG
jgi:hypothetical protein